MRLTSLSLVFYTLLLTAAAAKTDAGGLLTDVLGTPSPITTTSTSTSSTSDSSTSDTPTPTDTTTPSSPTTTSKHSETTSSEHSTTSTSPQTTHDSTTSSSDTSSVTPTVKTITTVTTIHGTTMPTVVTTTSSPTAAQTSPGLNGHSPQSSSGLSAAQKRIIIGVVVGVGGAILVGALALVIWRINKKRNARYSDEDDDLMGGTAVGSGPREKVPSPTGGTPFKNTLDQYHNPGPVNAASNF